MKILVLSLLRVGDLIQQRSLIRRLRARHPGAEIHVLANQGSLTAREIFPEVDLWHAFDREGFQKEVGTAEIPLMTPVVRLQARVQEIAREGYDLILNLTHNRLSAQLANMIPATEKRGLLAQGRGYRRLENNWLRHLNDRFGEKGVVSFHYVDTLAGAFGLEQNEPARLPGGRDILLQPFTSDAKKNWKIANWEVLLQALRTSYPDRVIRVLGAPFEKVRLLEHFDEADVEILDWKALALRLRSADVLITGDTSVKHLAASEGVRILELALGSANPRETGSYANNSWILSAQVACAPCAHRSPCRQASHLCGNALPISTVATIARRFIEGDTMSTTQLPTNVQLAETKVIAGLGHCVIPEWNAESVADLLDQAVWRAHLSGTALELEGLDEVLNERVNDETLTRALRTIRAEREALARVIANQIGAVREAEEAFAAGESQASHWQACHRELALPAGVPARVRRHLADLASLAGQPHASPGQFFKSFENRMNELRERIAFLAQIAGEARAEGKDDGKLARNVSVRRPEAS